MKTTVISSTDKRILYVSKVWVGKTHDYTILKGEFPPNLDWFAKFTVRLDSGYQGFQNDYKSQLCYLPIKRKKNEELTDTQKQENLKAAKERIKVEHSIAGLKRFRVLSERSRIRDCNLFDDMIGICAGLWNFLKNDTSS